MKKKLLIGAVLITLVLVFSGAPQAQTYSWKFASQEIDGDMMTVFAKKFADEMKQWSGGKVNITVYPYGTLGQERDIMELCQNNTVQLVFTDPGWTASFVPQLHVFALSYLWPVTKTKEVYQEVMHNGKAVKLMEEKLREKNFQPLGYLTEGWMAWTSNKPIKSIDDVKGMKMRIQGSKIMIETFRAYGGSPTSMDFGEVYSGLQMKLIEGQTNPIWVGYSMKFYEVQDYFTTVFDNIFVAIPTMNRDLYDSLPKEMQEKMKEICKKYLSESWEWSANKDATYKKIMLKDRPHIKFSRLRNEDAEPFRERARTVYQLYEKLGDEGAKEILEALLQDIEKAKAKYGVN